jgi:hypothetical protein
MSTGTDEIELLSFERQKPRGVTRSFLHFITVLNRHRIHTSMILVSNSLSCSIPYILSVFVTPVTN